MDVEALIFDVDGTLADTEEVHRSAFNLAFEHFRLGWQWDRSEYRKLLKTTGGKERIADYIAQLDLTPVERKGCIKLVPAIHAEKMKYYGSIISDGSVTLRDGVARLLDEALAAGCRLAIATTTSAENIDALMNATLGRDGLAMFSVIACGDQVRAKKPAPDIYQLALQRLGLAATQAVAFEDSENGLRSAEAAGLWTVVTPNFWTEGGDFGAAGLLLPRLGDPAAPLEGEPGGRLRAAAWLSFHELVEKAGTALQRRTNVQQVAL